MPGEASAGIRFHKINEKIKYMVEITTLVVPGINDSEKELKNIADFIVGVDKRYSLACKQILS